MARKVFISFLGTGNYGPCHYISNGYKSKEVRYVQEATLEYLMQKETWDKNDAAYILLTEGAEKANWNDDGHRDRNTNEIIRQKGLKSQLDAIHLPMQLNVIRNLPDGNDEKEIMGIFQRIFSEIHEGDILYFDLTHGFRYLPMLVLVLGNYSKFLRHAHIKSITYGNFEGRNKNTQEALLVNLMSLTNLQDWTFAAANFLENGNVNQLSSLSEGAYRSILKETKGKDENAQILRMLTQSLRDTVYDFQTCRGMNIYKSTSIGKLQSALVNIENTAIEPLNPVIKKIEESLADFSAEENVENGFHAAKWCLDNGLYQQAATILQENVVTYFALRHGIPIDDENEREIINKAMTILFNEIPESKWEIKDEYRDLLKDVLCDSLLQDKTIYSGFNNLTEVRNDLNHSGMRSKRLPMSPAKLRENIEKCVALFQNKLTGVC